MVARCRPRTQFDRVRDSSVALGLLNALPDLDAQLWARPIAVVGGTLDAGGFGRPRTFAVRSR